MKQVSFLLVLILLTSQFAFAQNTGVVGSVADGSDNSRVAGATVQILLAADSSIVKTTVTNEKGVFLFSYIPAGDYILTINTTDYDQRVRPLEIKEALVRIDEIKLTRKSKDLSEVVIVARAPAASQKGDTTQFSASAFKVNPDATIEDLIKKMPGIIVDKQTGKVTAQGEEVKKVTIDGKDFFGEDASAALRNLPSDAVDKIQVYDRLSDKAQLTGFDDGNSVKAINVVTKVAYRTGQFGRVFAGYGTDDRYSAGGNASFFKDSRRLSFVGNFNNINQQNFGAQDLLGVSSQNSSGRGRGRGGYGQGDNFSIGATNGITRTNAIGVNFSNVYDKKLTVTGSYLFNDGVTTNDNITNTQTFANANSRVNKNQFSDQTSNSGTDNSNHRINLRAEYKIDKKNTLTFIPSLNFQKNNYVSATDLKTYYAANDSLNTYNGIYNSDRNGYNLRNNLQFSHAFDKKGRSISFDLQTTFDKNDGESITNGTYRFFDSTGINFTDSTQNQFADNTSNGREYELDINYTEPLGKKGQLEFKYSPSIAKSEANQQVSDFDGIKYSNLNTQLSNKFENTTTKQGGEVSYRFVQNKDKSFGFGAKYENTLLESDRVFPTATNVSQRFNNILPNAFVRYKLGKYDNLRVFYRAFTRTPTVTQLQDVVNVSNPLRVSAGNPQLQQSTGTYLGSRYTYTNTKNNNSFYGFVFLQLSDNYVSNAIYTVRADSVIQQGIVLKSGSQLTKPVNLDGYRNFRSSFTYSMPIKAIKTNVNLTAGYTQAAFPGLINNVATKTKNDTYSGGAVLASNISQYIDFNINYNLDYNEANTTGGAENSTKYTSQRVGASLNLLNKKGWFIQNDVSNQSYTGLSEGLNQSYTLWNAAIGKKFLKNQAGELKLSVFDMLNQNQSINRSVSEFEITDTRNTVLQQYFMLTFTYSLKSFGKIGQSVGGEQGQGGGRPGGGGRH